MLYREFLSTGEKISVIGFGGIVVKGEVEKNVKSYVSFAYDNGVNYFDVAPAYGDAEKKLGPALSPYRKKIFLACKTGKRSYIEAKKEFENSLQNLKTDYLDLYQMHSVSSEDDYNKIVRDDGVLSFLIEMKEKGYIRNIGFSAHSSDIAVRLLSNYNFDSILFPLNFTTWHNAGFGKNILDKAIETNTTMLGLKAGALSALSENTINCKPAEGVTRVREKCWYAPIENSEIIKLAYKWALSKPITALLPPGEFDLWKQSLSVVDGFEEISEDEINLIDNYTKGKLPLFTV